jgi:putative phosphoesterase
MRLGILADTHDQLDRTVRAVRLLRDEGAEGFVHCGDLVGPAMLEAFAGTRLTFCFGNNDRDRDALRRAAAALGADCLEEGGTFSAGRRRVAVTHGHSPRERSRLLSTGPDFLFVGHSHRAGHRREGETIVCNPGALHRATRYTVALVDVDSRRVGSIRYLPVPR